MFNEEIWEALNEGKKPKKFGVVVCFDINRANQTITESGRTKVLPFEIAIEVYSEIPNPASQLLEFDDDEEMKQVEAELQKNIKDPEWLEQLFECI